MLTKNDLDQIRGVVKEEISTEINPLVKRFGSVETRLGSVDSKLKSVETRLGSVDSKLKSVETRLGSVEKGVKSLDKKLDQTQEDIAEILNVVGEHHDALERRVDRLEEEVGISKN